VKLAEVVERPGVVDEDVDAAVLLDGTCDRLVDLRAIAHVALEGRVGLFDVERDDLRTGALQRQRVSPAEPARTSGDDGDPTREVDLNHAALRRRHQDAELCSASV
jgi:hypothetical protein